MDYMENIALGYVIQADVCNLNDATCNMSLIQLIASGRTSYIALTRRLLWEMIQVYICAHEIKHLEFFSSILFISYLRRTCQFEYHLTSSSYAIFTRNSSPNYVTLVLIKMIDLHTYSTRLHRPQRDSHCGFQRMIKLMKLLRVASIHNGSCQLEVQVQCTWYIFRIG